MNTPSNPRPRARRAIVAGASLALAVAAAGCGGGGGGGGEDGPGSQQLDLVIGNVLPLSGPSKQLGESGQKASDLAVERINSAIDDSGADHSVRTIQQDEGGDPDAAGKAAKKLTDDGAGCLTGPWSVDAAEQTADDVAIPGRALEIAPVPASQDVTELSDHDLVNSTALPVSIEGTALADAIERDLGGADGYTVNVAGSNDDYGDTLTQDFIQAWQDRDGTVGGQVILAPPPLDSSSTDSSGYSSAYSGQAQQITSGSPDAVLVIDDPNGFSLLASPLSSYGWDPETAWGSDQLVNPGLPELVGSEAIEGMRALAPGSPKGEEPSSAFGQEFKSAEPRDVKQQPFAAQEFDATILCYLAAVAAGSTDSQKMADDLIDITAPGGDEFSWQQLPDAIEALENGEDIDYVGASGPLDMDVHGNPTSGVFDVYRYTGEGLEVVDEVSVEKPNPATP
jgi:ABC-type branched-subunit amino acid transport system substrate-binding protein